MINREYVMLGHHAKPNWRVSINLSDYVVSEKLDGVRAIWIPWTRGVPFQEVEFANKFRDSRSLESSGLWSRRGKPIFAPSTLLDALPKNLILDGELFAGRGQFQTAVSAVRKLIPDPLEWSGIKYMLFDVPTPMEFYSGGRIRIDKGQYITMGTPPFGVDYDMKGGMGSVQSLIKEVVGRIGNASLVSEVEQIKMPLSQSACVAMMDQLLGRTFDLGGEGLMLRHAMRQWTPKRCDTLIKIVDCLDDVGTYTGNWQPGEGRLSGYMGSIELSWSGKTFNLSGFTDSERRLLDNKPAFFRTGQQIKFKYRELTDLGIPKQPRYFRLDHGY